MLKRHGDEADIESAIGAEELAEAGDRAGEAVWRRLDRTLPLANDDSR